MIRFTPGFDGNGNPTMNPDPNGAWVPRARVAELEQAFRSYAQHDDQCRAMSYGDSQCTCGYSTVLRTLSPE